MFKKYSEFCAFSKHNYLFIEKCFVPFKVISMRSSTLVKTVFPDFEALKKPFFNLVQLLLRCRLYPIKRSVTLAFLEPLQFRKQKKSQEARSREYSRCEIISVLFSSKKLRTSDGVWTGALSWCKKPILVFLQFRANLGDCFVQLAHNYQVVILVDRFTLWQELMVNNAPAIQQNCQKKCQQNCQQNFYIWPE